MDWSRSGPIPAARSLICQGGLAENCQEKKKEGLAGRIHSQMAKYHLLGKGLHLIFFLSLSVCQSSQQNPQKLT